MRIKEARRFLAPKFASNRLFLPFLILPFLLAGCGDFTVAPASTVPAPPAATTLPPTATLGRTPSTTVALSLAYTPTAAVSTTKAATSTAAFVSPTVTTFTLGQEEAIGNLKDYYAALANGDYKAAYDLVIRPDRSADDLLNFTHERQSEFNNQALADLKVVQSDPSKGNLIIQTVVRETSKHPEITLPPEKDFALPGDKTRYVEMVRDGGIWRIAQIREVPITDETSFVTLQAKPPVFESVFDFSFIDARQGWAAGTYCTAFGFCRALVRITSDGGRNWQPGSAPPVEPGFFMDESSNHKQVGRIHFANATDGWLFGPGFYSTHDGGASWQSEKVSEDVVELASVGNKTLAVSRICTKINNAGLCDYAFGLLSSADNGYNWQKMPGFPAIPGPEAQFLALSQNDFWLVSRDFGPSNDPDPSTAQTIPTLVVTHDGGKSWQRLINPCLGRGSIDARLAAANLQELWFLCASTPATDMQDKYLYLSHDGGKTWKTIDSMQGTGIGYNSRITASGPGKFWLALSRNTLLTSGDGGLNWKEAVPFEQGNPGDSGMGPVAFADATHGWVASRNLIFLTVDGGATWSPVELK